MITGPEDDRLRRLELALFERPWTEAEAAEVTCLRTLLRSVPKGWREWLSPNDVLHLIPPTGPCATCGNGRHQ